MAAAAPRRGSWRSATACGEMYGRPRNEPHGDPVHELVLTILSQNTSDTNRDVAYAGLRGRFATWEEVRDAPTDEVEEAIRPGGLAPTKAPRIQAVLRELGDADRPRLAARRAARGGARRTSTSLPGVGRKTAACVMIFSFDRPEIPVDTHVQRVGGRLGLFRAERLVRRGARRDARDHAARGRLRAPHEPDRARPAALPPGAAAVRRVRASAHVPVRAPGAIADVAVCGRTTDATAVAAAPRARLAGRIRHARWSIGRVHEHAREADVSPPSPSLPSRSRRRPRTAEAGRRRRS